MKQKWIFIFILMLAALACNLPFLTSPETIATQTSSAKTDMAGSQTVTPTISLTPTITVTPTFPPSQTPTITRTPTISQTPPITLTPTITPSRTFVFPVAVVNKQAHCRYGPSVSYLHAADLYIGDTGTVRSRSIYGNWLFIKFDKLNYFCWVAPTVVDVSGEVESLYRIDPDSALPGPSIYYFAPKNVKATRFKNKVIITWDRVEMTKDKDRGYLLELFVCQKYERTENGNDVTGYNYIWWTQSFDDQYTTSFSIEDVKGCPEASTGKIFTVEKHGYSEPKTIPNWPKQP